MPTYQTPVGGVAFSVAYAEAITTAHIGRVMPKAWKAQRLKRKLPTN